MSKLTITLWKALLETENGSQKQISWEQLGSFLNSPSSFNGKNHPGWSAAAFRDNTRGLSYVELAHALVLDFDDTTPADALRAIFVGRTYYVHSSKSNAPATPRYRAVLRLSRPVAGPDYYRVWRVYTDRFSARVDQACKDPSRFWYRPCRTPETKWEFWGETGEPIDVEPLIARGLEIEAAEEAARAEIAKHVQLRPEKRGSNDVRRAQAYIAKMDPAISGSHGHDATWKVACTLVWGFALDAGTALSILASDYNPRCQPPWSLKDLERKIQQADTKARDMTRGYLLGDSDGYTPSHLAKIPAQPPPDPDPDYVPEPPPELGYPDHTEEFAAMYTAASSNPTASAEHTAPPKESKPAPPKQEQSPSGDAPVILTPAQKFGAFSVQQLILDVLTDVNKPPDVGCPTGIGQIDELIGGLRPKMVTVVGASTSFGKSTLGLMSANETLKVSKRPLILTFEDAPLLYGRRLTAIRSRVNFLKLRDRDTRPEDRARIIRAAGAAETDAFLVDCIGKTAEYATKVIDDLVKAEGLDLVLVDYIQRIKVDKRTQDRRNEVTYAVGIISDAIKNSGVAGMLLSQLKRLKDGEEPENDDLKESGDIECFAEHIILGWRDSEENRLVKLTKNKDGPICTAGIRLEFDKVTAAFIPTEALKPKNDNDRAHDDVAAALDAEFY